jgi:hypothetical protein
LSDVIGLSLAQEFACETALWSRLSKLARESAINRNLAEFIMTSAYSRFSIYPMLAFASIRSIGRGEFGPKFSDVACEQYSLALLLRLAATDYSNVSDLDPKSKIGTAEMRYLAAKCKS